MKLRIGIAVGTNDTHLIPLLYYLKRENLLDYVELYARPDATFKQLYKWQETCLVEVVHAPHDEKARTRNEDVIFGKNIANFIGDVRGVVYDPGSDEDIIDDDGKVWPETMPFITSFSDITPFNIPSEVTQPFCLDFVHVWLTCQYLQTDYLNTLKEFMKKKPAHFHIGNTGSFYNDTHCLLSDGLVPLEDALKLLPDNSTLTLELDHEIANREETIEKELECLKFMFSPNIV